METWKGFKGVSKVAILMAEGEALSPLEQHRLAKIAELSRDFGETSPILKRADIMSLSGMTDAEWRYFAKYSLLRGITKEGSELRWYTINELLIARELLRMKRNDRFGAHILQMKSQLLYGDVPATGAAIQPKFPLD